MTEKILIIGAGMSGLAAARRLAMAGKEVSVFDKGRRIGGRVATRRADGFVFDHGAQFFTAYQDPLTSLCQQAESDGKLQRWTRPSGKPAFIGASMMRDFPDWLSQLPNGKRLPIQQSVEIARIEETGHVIQLFNAKDTRIAEGDQLIMTAPAPQTEKLLKQTAPELSETAATAAYHPCWTVLLGLDTDIQTALPEIESPDSDLSFVADSRSRRPKLAGTDNPAASLILQASAVWSQTYLEDSADEIITRLQSLYETHLHQHKLTLPDIGYQSAHRWRYAKLAKAADIDAARISRSGRIHIAGDWLAAPRIEAAFMSGVAAADRILDGSVQ